MYLMKQVLLKKTKKKKKKLMFLLSVIKLIFKFTILISYILLKTYFLYLLSITFKNIFFKCTYFKIEEVDMSTYASDL